MSTITTKRILDRVYEAGFRNSIVVEGSGLLRALGSRETGLGEPETLQSVLGGFEAADMPVERCALLVCALSYYRRQADDLSTPDDPQGLIAPFARANFYREAVERLRGVCRWLREQTGVLVRETRIFCNSRLPEKLLAALAGLGFYGKNSLLISPGLGSRFIIALLAFPARVLCSDTPAPTPAAAPGSRCGDCVACINACPTQALHTVGRVDGTLCLQELATKLHILPEGIKKLWGTRLYGCESCQDACPFNRGLVHSTETHRGVTGPGVSIARLLGLSVTQVKAFFKPTPMGMSWINPLALVRNALLAAGNSGNKILVPAVTPYLTHEHEAVNDAARWALAELLGR